MLTFICVKIISLSSEGAVVGQIPRAIHLYTKRAIIISQNNPREYERALCLLHLLRFGVAICYTSYNYTLTLAPATLLCKCQNLLLCLYAVCLQRTRAPRETRINVVLCSKPTARASPQPYWLVCVCVCVWCQAYQKGSRKIHR